MNQWQWQLNNNETGKDKRMCKLMAFTDLSKLESIDELAQVVHEHITKSDDDGFGWAVVTNLGVCGERTLKTESYTPHIGRTDTVKLPIVKQNYNTFGTLGQLSGPAMFHGRTSTNSVSLVNTHPIVKDHWYLVHNGVVSNHGAKYSMQTTNDTEHLVHYMSQANGIESIEKHITGYYAFAVIDPQERLHIVKDNIAGLCVAYVNELECHVFGTTETLIQDVCDAMDWTIGPIDTVEDNIYIIIDHNEMTYKQSIKPRGYDKVEAIHMDKSLHYLEREYNGAGEIVDATCETSIADYDNIEEYLRECSEIDSSYEIYTEAGEEVNAYDFRKMDTITKLQCLVIRPDGTEVTPVNYYEPKLA